MLILGSNLVQVSTDTPDLKKREKKHIDLKENPIKVVAPTETDCFVLLEDGTINRLENNESDDGKTVTRVADLNGLKAVDLFAGGNHSFVITEDGKVHGWGANDHGQLGWKDDDANVVHVPKESSLFHEMKVAQIACGKLHSIMLMQDGRVHSMGDNTYGQLGVGNFSTVSKPVELSSLTGLPISQVAAGSWHSFCVTFSGRVFCWGRNDCGQLGLGGRSNRHCPTLLGFFLPSISYVAAGECHSALLSKKGQLFMCGSSSRGQLGLGSLDCRENPSMVPELIGSVVTQVTCGLNHTIAYVPGSQNVFAFGCGKYGQCGQDSGVDHYDTPVMVQGDWCRIQNKLADIESDDCPLVRNMTAGGNQTIIVLRSLQNESPLDSIKVSKQRSILSLTSEFCLKFESATEETHPTPAELSELDCFFSSLSCINASFPTNDEHCTNKDHLVVDLYQARLLFDKICSCRSEEVLQTVQRALEKLLTTLPQKLPDVEALTMFIVLPELQLLQDSDLYQTLLFPFIEKLLNLPKDQSNVLDRWFLELEPDYFLTHVNMCKKCIVILLARNVPEFVLRYLKRLHDTNFLNKDPIVDYHHFYIPELNELLNLESQYINFVISNGTTPTFCDLPFILETRAKTKLLQCEARIRWIGAQCLIAQDSVFGMQGLVEPPIITLTIRRERILMDAVETIDKITNLSRPLVIKFVGEEGQDDGGLRKEFFMLVIQKVLGPAYGLFKEHEDSRLLWFSGDPGNVTDPIYRLVGTVCGLAMYNSTIVNTNFPLAIYKKLLGISTTLDDLRELDPIVGNSLLQLLEFEEDDEDTVEKMFSSPSFVMPSGVSLVENGEEIPVTSKNRSEYVDEYVNYVLNRAVERQFKCFCDGFNKVCDKSILRLFRPEEMREMVAGKQDYDWNELERGTVYAEPYTPEHRNIIWFWEVFHSLSSEEKKEFVMFLTGCDKIPIDGLELRIQPKDVNVEDVDEVLPVAHTCFNILDLPLYSSQEKLANKLKLALKGNIGFYLP